MPAGVPTSSPAISLWVHSNPANGNTQGTRRLRRRIATASQRYSRHFRGHPWDEKDLQRQKSVGLLLGIQERSVLFVPVINRGLTDCQCCSSIGLIGFRLFVLLKKRSGDFSSIVKRMRETRTPRRTVLSAFRRSALLPRRRKPRSNPLVVCLGFGFDRLSTLDMFTRFRSEP